MSSQVGRLCLGTAKFGLDNYPPGSARPKPSRAESIAIIDAAYRAGIRHFDTAQAYGNAEDILEEALAGRPASVTTKCLATAWAPSPRGWVTLQHNPTVGWMDPLADGASVYERGEAFASIIDAEHRHLQVPFWLMDTSFASIFGYARRMGVTTYARQPYGRGQVPCQAALWFALNSPADYIVFGARTIAQLDDTLRWAESTPPTPLLPSVCTRR